MARLVGAVARILIESENSQTRREVLRSRKPRSASGPANQRGGEGSLPTGALRPRGRSLIAMPWLLPTGDA